MQVVLMINGSDGKLKSYGPFDSHEAAHIFRKDDLKHEGGMLVPLTAPTVVTGKIVVLSGNIGAVVEEMIAELKSQTIYELTMDDVSSTITASIQDCRDTITRAQIRSAVIAVFELDSGIIAEKADIDGMVKEAVGEALDK